MASTQTTFGMIARPIASQFHHVAPDDLKWAIEREFLYAQIFRAGNEEVIAQIEAGVEDCIESVRRAARSAAAMGLTMNPMAALVYFVPRRARERDPVAHPEDKSLDWYKANVPWLVTATPSYRGLAFICTHYAGFLDVVASEVYQADIFRYFGPRRAVEHEATLVNDARTEKLAIGAYCELVAPDKSVRAEYMDAPTIAMARSMSKNSNGLMWTKFWTEGWKKAVTRRACKLAMQSHHVGVEGRNRMAAAEATMTAADGVTLNEQGEIEPEVPRGTESVEPRRERRRGMSGLKGRLDDAETRHTAQAEAGASERPPAAQPLLALPAPSKHPEGTIEWWVDQIMGSTTVQRLEEIRVAAMTTKLHEGDDAPTFRDRYADRKRAIREGKML